MKFSDTYLVGLMCKLNEIIHGEHLAQCWVHRGHNTWELVFSDLWLSAWRSYQGGLHGRWRVFSHSDLMACQGSSIYLENTKHDLIFRVDVTLITPLVLTGSDHCSNNARPFSCCSTVKLLSPLGEDSRVWTTVQGLETSPAWFVATIPTWYVVNGSNPNRWAWWLVPCTKINRLVFFQELLTIAGRSFSDQGTVAMATQISQQSFELLGKHFFFTVLHTWIYYLMLCNFRHTQSMDQIRSLPFQSL